MDEQNLLQILIERESWEDLVHQIVTLEGMNPWDVDIVKLTDSFLKYIEGMKLLDFRIPAKVVIVASLLLKMKVQALYFRGNEEETEYGVEQPSNLDEFMEMRMKLANLSLTPPVERYPKRAVTLDELVGALRKAMKVQEKKVVRRRTLGRRITSNINIEEEDIEVRIKKLMDDIDGLLKKLKENKVEFSKIVDRWETEEIVRHFLPLLYLSSRGKVGTEQPKFFEEILISKK